MSFQLTRAHTSVVLAATTIAASLVVIPTLAEGTAVSEDAFCNSLSGAEGRITAEYNPLLASYAAAAAGSSSVSAADPARESELRAALADAQAALEAAQQAALGSTPSTGDAGAASTTTDRGLDWVDWSQVDDATQARIIEALVVQKMNAYRANAGLPELVVSDTVTTDARSWSQHMSETDTFNHDPDYRYFGPGKLDGGDTTYAGENIAYNHRENFGDEWGAYGTTKNPMQAANALFDQWKKSPGHDKNMLAQNNVVGVGVHIAQHGEFTRIYGTQKFYAITGGSPDVSRFHTTGDAASAYGFNGGAYNADNTNYVSGLAGGGDEQRANSWQNKVGALPGVALPVDVSALPSKGGSATASTSTPAPAAPAADVDKQQAVIDAQASVNEAQSALDAYLASVADEKPAVSLADIDVELDRVADSIAAQTSVHPEKDGGVTLRSGDQAGRYLTATDYRDALTRCTTPSVGTSDPVNPSIDEGEQDARDPSDPAVPSAPSVGGEQKPAPGGEAPAPQDPITPAPSNSSVDGGQAPAPVVSAPAANDPVTQVPSVQVPVAPATVGPARGDSPTSTPAQTRRNTLAATGASGVWVGVGAVAVLVAGVGAVVASRRSRR